MFCYFYDDDIDDDDLPNVLTLKVVYQGVGVVECFGINGLFAVLSVGTVQSDRRCGNDPPDSVAAWLAGVSYTRTLTAETNFKKVLQ